MLVRAVSNGTDSTSAPNSPGGGLNLDTLKRIEQIRGDVHQAIQRNLRQSLSHTQITCKKQKEHCHQRRSSMPIGVHDNSYWLARMRSDAARRKANGGGGGRVPISMADLADPNATGNYSDTRVMPSSVPEANSSMVDGRNAISSFSSSASSDGTGDVFFDIPLENPQLGPAASMPPTISISPEVGPSHARAHSSRPVKYLTIVTTEVPGASIPPVFPLPSAKKSETDSTPLLLVAASADYGAVPEHTVIKAASKWRCLWCK